MEEDNIFKTFDYILFFLSLCIPMSISVYFGCYGNKHKSGSEYLYGKQNLNAWTVGLSLYSGTISSLTILGTASEVYIFGTQFMIVAIGSFVSTLVIWYFVLPVFVGNLALKTPYEVKKKNVFTPASPNIGIRALKDLNIDRGPTEEDLQVIYFRLQNLKGKWGIVDVTETYFEMRFNRKVRIAMSTLSAIHSLSFMPVVLFASTLPFSEATNISLPICTTIVGVICTIYTLVGGFIGVIWTDVIQASLMLFSCIFVMIRGVNEAGGITQVWTVAEEGERIEFFNIDPNPFVRLSFWSAFLGMLVLETAYGGCAPGALQRFMAVSTEKGARISATVATVGYGLFVLMAGLIGLSIYARYSDCDPISSNQISTASRILPFFINDIAGNIPGFVGFFSAGLLSAGLSSISADMNVLSGIVCYDFLPNIVKINDKKYSDILIMKISVLIFGIILMIIAPIMAKYQYIYQVALSLSAMSYAPITGVTILATTIPKINSTGTLWGILSSVLVVGTLIIATFNLDLASNYALPVSTGNCSIQNNFTELFTSTVKSALEESHVETNEPFILFKLSFMYYTVLGFIVTVLVALIVSYCTGMNDVHKMNSDLIIPVLRAGNDRTIELKSIRNCDD